MSQSNYPVGGRESEDVLPIADSRLPTPDSSFLPTADYRPPTTALCLSGGGSKGAWECGVIKYLAEQGLEFDCFAGTSVGAINAAFLAQYKNLLEGVAALEAQWRAVDDSKIRKPWNRVFGDFAAIDHESIYDSSPLWDWISSLIVPARVSGSGKALRVVSTSLSSGQKHVASEADPHIDIRVQASSAFPIAFRNVHYDSQRWCDGGIRSNTPLGAAIDSGATDITVVMAHDPKKLGLFDPSSLIYGVALRSLELLFNTVEYADLRSCLEKNDLSQTIAAYRKVTIRLIMPTGVLAQTLDFSPPQIAAMIDQGFKDGATISDPMTLTNFENLYGTPKLTTSDLRPPIADSRPPTSDSR